MTQHFLNESVERDRDTQILFARKGKIEFKTGGTLNNESLLLLKLTLRRLNYFYEFERSGTDEFSVKSLIFRVQK